MKSAKNGSGRRRRRGELEKKVRRAVAYSSVRCVHSERRGKGTCDLFQRSDGNKRGRGGGRGAKWDDDGTERLAGLFARRLPTNGNSGKHTAGLWPTFRRECVTNEWGKKNANVSFAISSLFFFPFVFGNVIAASAIPSIPLSRFLDGFFFFPRRVGCLTFHKKFSREENNEKKYIFD